MQVTREQLNGLFEELGVNTKRLSNAKLLGRVQSLPDRLEEGTELEDNQELLDEILAAIEDEDEIEIVKEMEEEEEEEEEEDEIEIVSEEDEEEDEEEEETPKKPAKKKAGKKKAAKKKAGKKAPAKKKTKGPSPKGVGVARSTIFGKSSSSVLKWMGAKGFGIEQARKVVDTLAEGSVSPSTISTSLSDGRSEKYSKGAAELTKKEEGQIRKLVGSPSR